MHFFFFLKIYSQREWSKLLSFNYPLGYWSYCLTLSLKKSKGVSKDFIFLLRMQSFHPLYQKYEKLGSDFIKPLYLRLVKGKVFILETEKRTIFNTPTPSNNLNQLYCIYLESIRFLLIWNLSRLFFLLTIFILLQWLYTEGIQFLNASCFACPWCNSLINGCFTEIKFYS